MERGGGVVLVLAAQALPSFLHCNNNFVPLSQEFKKSGENAQNYFHRDEFRTAVEGFTCTLFVEIKLGLLIFKSFLAISIWISI